MKKKRTALRFPRGSAAKILLKMKLLTVFLLSVISVSAANLTYSQSTKFNLKLNNFTVKEVFLEIEENSEFILLYNEEDVDVNRKVDVNVHNKTVGAILDQVFADTQNTYKIYERQIVILRDKNAEVPAIFKGRETVAVQQQKSVSGTVTDESGQPLPGVTILIKATTQGTVTNVDGTYLLDNISGDETLVFSFVGMRTQEIIIDNSSVINVIMEIDAIGIDEVVAIGYGTMKKRDITGSVASVRTEDLEAIPAVDITQVMQGRMSGVQIQQNSGELDGNFKVLVRGIGTFSGSNDPLYVIDGIPVFNSDLSSLNQNNIQSIDVLKDASATAIYGARAANGVVLITTKSGNYNQKAKVTFNVQNGIDVVSNYLDVMNAKQFAEFYIASYTNTNPNYNPPPELLDDAWLTAPEQNHDWQRMITRQGYTQDYNVNVAGGSKDIKYSINGGYLSKKGVLLNTDFERATIGANLESKLSDKITTGLVFNASRSKNNYTVNDFTYATFYYRNSFQMKPWVPATDEEIEESKQYTSSLYGNVANPARALSQEIRSSGSTRFLGNLSLEWEIIDNLKFKSSAGSDLTFNHGYDFYPVYDWYYNKSTEVSVDASFGERINWVTDQLLTYDNYINTDHHITATAGFSAQQIRIRNIAASGYGGTDNNLNQVGNQPETTGGGSYKIGAGLVSYFGRAFYSYRDKYLLTATIRRDGSSRFGAGHKWGTFPSVALGWRISEEAFLHENTIISNLKLRTSYGITGNQDIGDFAYLALASTGVAVFGNDAVVSNTPRNFANEDLKWESAKQTSVGIDLGLLDNRISLNAELYHILNEDILIQIPSPPVAGVSQDPTVNLGSLTNDGFEISLNTINIKSTDFSWSTSFNISSNKNEIKDIGKEVTGEDRVIFGSLSRGIPAIGRNNLWRTQSGYEISSLWGYKRLGIWQLDEADEAATFGRAPGDTKYQDTNPDGKYTDDDMVYIGSPWPKYYGGLSNTFKYKNFTLDVFFNYQQGNKLVNLNRIYMTSGPIGVGNKLVEMYGNWWTPDNPEAEFARPFQGGRGWENVALSQEYIEDASFIRLKNISFSYDIPKSILNNLSVSSASITLVAVNLLTFTKYKGQDPEGSSGNREYTSGSANNALTQGMDRQPYPFAKTYMAKLNLTF